MELEIINKLYLELSQVATARTSREIACEEALREIYETPMKVKDSKRWAVTMKDLAQGALGLFRK
jgi:hypothetical protein